MGTEILLDGKRLKGVRRARLEIAPESIIVLQVELMGDIRVNDLPAVVEKVQEITLNQRVRFEFTEEGVDAWQRYHGKKSGLVPLLPSVLSLWELMAVIGDHCSPEFNPCVKSNSIVIVSEDEFDCVSQDRDEKRD